MVKFVVKCVVKFVVTLKNCQIGTKIGVVVDMDPIDYDKEIKRQKNKKMKR